MISNVGPVLSARTLTVTVDLAIFTVSSAELQVLLIRRGNEPFRGMLALPGGFVRPGESLDDAALRELSEETGVDGRTLHLDQIQAYGAPERDPRGRVITVAYLALGPDLPAPQAGSDAQAADWIPVASVLDPCTELAFDHAVILREALEKARSQIEYTTAAAAFCPEPFTIADLRHVYEAVWSTSLDPSNFRRKVTRAEDFIEPTGDYRNPDIGRPAPLYRRGNAHALFPPLLRSANLREASEPLSSRRCPRLASAYATSTCPYVLW
jgi:8-oxo-dGTP diphosphatase